MFRRELPNEWDQHECAQSPIAPGCNAAALSRHNTSNILSCRSSFLTDTQCRRQHTHKHMCIKIISLHNARSVISPATNNITTHNGWCARQKINCGDAMIAAIWDIIKAMMLIYSCEEMNSERETFFVCVCICERVCSASNSGRGETGLECAPVKSARKETSAERRVVLRNCVTGGQRLV
jgi:hypothetical protein